MKKKVLFMVINMNVGGTEKALLNMIDVMPEEQYDITILMLEPYGGFLGSIPDGVKVEYVNGYSQMKDILNNPPKIVVMNFLKQWKLLQAFYYLILFLITSISKERSLLFASLLRHYPINQNEYDVAVAYAGPMDFISYFIVKKIKAKKKYQWIHFDISKIGFNVKFASQFFVKFDKVFAVSEEGKKEIVNLVPTVKNNTEVFTNITIPEKIINLAKEGNGFQDNFNGLRILTVGRLSKEKGQDLIIPVLARLKHEGFNIRWYCIGEGNGRKEYEAMIKEYDVENDFILLGSHSNPYPFMQQCDLYVQPSRHEGYCLTMAEAKCFNIPIVSTKFAGVSEHIAHEKTGLIVECNSTSIYQAVKVLLQESRLKDELRFNLKSLNIASRLKKIDL
ncbi:glycosyltransferase [Heyndrickxia sp. MSNUG]|uniref:glycosyltransferase n=1 Tax=Heyndrickxia sp. MSNUG TaxID=3136677 RepID=UPI003C2F640F